MVAESLDSVIFRTEERTAVLEEDDGIHLLFIMNRESESEIFILTTNRFFFIFLN